MAPQSEELGKQSRIPPQPREELRSDRQEFYDYFRDSVSRNAPHPGAADRAGNTLFPVLAVLPKTGRTQVDLLALLEQEAEGLPADAREVVSLVATTHFRSAYVTHIHKMMAVKQKTLTEAQAEALAAGRKPEDLNGACSLAYDIAYHLLEVRGPLSQELFDRGVRAFGMEGTVGLTHHVALLSWTAMGLNVANVPVPSAPVK